MIIPRFSSTPQTIQSNNAGNCWCQPLLMHCVMHYAQAFRAISDSPRLDAEILLQQVTGCSRTTLLAHPEMVLTQLQHQQLEQLSHRRLQGEPIAYLTGRQAFWNTEFSVTEEVLIPRPETESLVEWVLAVTATDQAIRLAELGVGSGAIAISLALERPHWMIHATDDSEPALRVARQNAVDCSAQHIQFFQGDWCHALPRQDYHVIVSNPPYLSKQDPHLSQLCFEPTHALVADLGGLGALQKIITQAKDYLVTGGLLIVEHGYNQRDAVLHWLQQAQYSDVCAHQDLGGRPRFCTAYAPHSKN